MIGITLLFDDAPPVWCEVPQIPLANDSLSYEGRAYRVEAVAWFGTERTWAAQVRCARLLLDRIEVRQGSAMSTYLVTIQDKTLYGEPDVALAVVEALDEEAALCAAHPTIMELIDRGRCRCVPHARLLEPGKFYRLGAVVRLPHDPNSEEPYDPEIKKEEDERE